MKKNKALMMMWLLWWGILPGWTENVIEDSKGDGINTQVSYLCYLSLGFVLLCLIFHFYKIKKTTHSVVLFLQLIGVNFQKSLLRDCLQRLLLPAVFSLYVCGRGYRLPLP